MFSRDEVYLFSAKADFKIKEEKILKYSSYLVKKQMDAML